MPELPEVETIKKAADKAVHNSNILGAKVYCNKFRINIPDDFCKKITGTKIKKVRRIAKYMALDLDNKYTIIWHLGMSGKIKICESTPEKLEKHDHVVIETSKCTLIYNDARRFGLITLVKTDEVMKHKLFKNMGIEPFDKNLTADFLYEKLRNKKIPIKTALLDQSIIVGIGNIYASEALYTARIDPRRKACDITEPECAKIIDAVTETLNKAIDAGGSTLRDYKKPDGSMGYFQNLHCVYNKIGQKCPYCVCDIKKTKGITKIVQAGRSTFYCPTLQK